MDLTDEDIEETLESLVDKGYLEKALIDGQVSYRVTPEGEAAFREADRINSGINNTKNTQLN